MISPFREVSGKVAVITGAARGIGRSCAEALAAEGIHVVVTDVLPEVEQTFASIHAAHPENRGFAKIVDVSREEQVKSLIEETVKTFGHLDILCNNAGINGGALLVTEAKEETVDRIFGVNFKGVFFGCKYGGLQMMKQGYGTIVNTGSWYGKVGHAASGIYGASKNAIHTLTQAFAMEMAPYGVTVNAVCPALADSEMHWSDLRKAAAARGITPEQVLEEELPSIPLHRLGTGADFAGAVMWLASRSGSYVTGQLINVNGGIDFS